MTENPLWYIVDSTKAKDYLECPRKFWWRHILGWEPEGSNLNLVFGEAFHKVMEQLLLTGYTVDSVEAGMAEFNKVYRAVYPEETDSDRAPKNAVFAELAAIEYIKNYASDQNRFSVLHTEVSGSVAVIPASDDRRLTKIYFKMDSILRDSALDAIVSFEHKTTGQSHTTRYGNQWPLSFQIGTYTHVMRSFYPPEEVWGIIVNSISLMKTKNHFQRYPVRKTTPQMEVWLNIADGVLWNIEQDLVNYQEELESPDLTMHTFPLNPTSCDKWYGCPYLDFCVAWENPIERVLSFTEPPEGFKVSFWDPRAIETREKMEL